MSAEGHNGPDPGDVVIAPQLNPEVQEFLDSVLVGTDITEDLRRNFYAALGARNVAVDILCDNEPSTEVHWYLLEGDGTKYVIAIGVEGVDELNGHFKYKQFRVPDKSSEVYGLTNNLNERADFYKYQPDIAPERVSDSVGMIFGGLSHRRTLFAVARTASGEPVL